MGYSAPKHDGLLPGKWVYGAAERAAQVCGRGRGSRGFVKLKGANLREIRWGRITKMGDMLPEDKGAAGGKRAALGATLG